LYIYLPTGMSSYEEKKWINKMIQRTEIRKRKNELNDEGPLEKRANELNKKYFGDKLKYDIKLVTNQNLRFGSCTPENRTIRISDRVAEMPRWVQDYIILHEMAHLIHQNHSKEFWKIVNQYKYSERARGFLIAFNILE